MNLSETSPLPKKHASIPRDNLVVPPMTRHSGSNSSAGGHRARPGHFLIRLRQYHKNRNRILTASSQSPTQSS
jgi:hypothetical protein